MSAPTDREPTADERAGMAWWNAMSEHARREWLRKARSAVPAEAWAAYRAGTSGEFTGGSQRP